MQTVCSWFCQFFSEAKWPIYGLPQHLRNHRSLTHGRRHLSVSFSRRLLKRSPVSSTRRPPSPVHWTLYSHVAVETSDSAHSTCHLQGVQSLTTQLCFPTPVPLKQALVLLILKKNNLLPVRIDPSQICRTSPKSSSVWLPGGSHHICLILVFYQPDSPPTVPSTPRRRRCCPCVTTWLAPSTTVKFHCSCCLTSAQLSTPWIIIFYCQYYPNALLWPTPHLAGSTLTSLTAHRLTVQYAGSCTPSFTAQCVSVQS